jgi:hypothetical protein
MVMRKNKSYLFLLLVLMLSSCLKIDFTPVKASTSTCHFNVGDAKYVQIPDTRVKWRNSAYEMGHKRIMLRVDFICDAKTNPIAWLGRDDNGNELCLGPAFWFCIHDDIKKGDTYSMFDRDNAIAISKKVVIRDGDKEHYSFYAFHDLAYFKTMSVTCRKNDDKEIILDFGGEIELGPEGDKRTVKIENGYIYLSRGSQNGSYTSREEWTKDRDQYQYWQ